MMEMNLMVMDVRETARKLKMAGDELEVTQVILTSENPSVEMERQYLMNSEMMGIYLKKMDVNQTEEKLINIGFAMEEVQIQLIYVKSVLMDISITLSTLNDC